MLSVIATGRAGVSPRVAPLAALGGSIAIHVFGMLVVAIIPASNSSPAPIAVAATAASKATTRMVFTVGKVRGPTSGGGGGGNRQAGPIRRAESRGRDAITVRIAKPVATSGAIIDSPPLPGLLLDAKPLAHGTREMIGLPSGGVDFGSSTGSGSGGGVGTGTGTGVGSGRGPGIGAGSGGGIGGGVFRVGGGVTAPQLIRQVRPRYTADAMERRIHGSVVLELVVTAAGAPSQIRVVRSLDQGLDREAIDAVAQWTFTPGHRNGVPVAVIVTVVLDFMVR